MINKDFKKQLTLKSCVYTLTNDGLLLEWDKYSGLQRWVWNNKEKPIDDICISHKYYI